MSENTRPTLLERLRDGSDTLAWTEFFQRYWPLVYAYARRRGCSEHTAEEIVQDVMLKVFQRKDVFRYDPCKGRFRDWLGVLVRNRVIERARRSDRARAAGGDSLRAMAQLDSGDAGPDAVWEAAFEEALLAAMLDVVRRQMRPRTYQAFELFFLQEVPAGKVAKLTGMTRNAVYQARKEVVNRLRRLGSAYREEGQLRGRIKQALILRPAGNVERSLTARVTSAMQSAWESPKCEPTP